MGVKERYEGVQSWLGDNGCLFLSLCSIAEEVNGESVDVLGVLKHAKQQGYINSNDDLTVEGQCLLLRDLTGKQWTRQVVKQLGTVPQEMYTVERWCNSRTGYVHFKRRGWDTIKDSRTVREGVRTDYYCYVYEEVR